MTWGTPEFVAVAKQAEEQASVDERVKELTEELCQIVCNSVFSHETFEQARQEVKRVFELFDETEVDGY